MKRVMLISIVLLMVSGFAGAALAASLEWNPVSGEVDGYKVYYGTSSGSFTRSVDVGKTTAYSLNGLSLAAGTEYFFAVKAYNTAGEGAYSNVVSWTPGDTTPPLPPTGLKVD